MKVYRVSTAGRIRAAAILATLGLIFAYSGRKAFGLWGGVGAKPSDPQLFNLNLNTTVPAILLTLVALGCAATAWHIVVELVSQVRVDESGILVNAPGYRLFYRWNEVAAVDVLNEPEEDMPAQLRMQVVAPAGALDPSGPAAVGTEDEPTASSDDEVAAFLSEADLRENRAARRRQRQAQHQQLAVVRARAIRPDGRPLPYWLRLLYPQARHPDRILLYPTLEDRPGLIAEIEQHLARA